LHLVRLSPYLSPLISLSRVFGGVVAHLFLPGGPRLPFLVGNPPHKKKTSPFLVSKGPTHLLTWFFSPCCFWWSFSSPFFNYCSFVFHLSFHSKKHFCIPQKDFSAFADSGFFPGEVVASVWTTLPFRFQGVSRYSLRLLCMHFTLPCGPHSPSEVLSGNFFFPFFRRLNLPSAGRCRVFFGPPIPDGGQHLFGGSATPPKPLWLLCASLRASEAKRPFITHWSLKTLSGVNPLIFAPISFLRPFSFVQVFSVG